MKKTILLTMAFVWAMALNAASYGIMINSSDYHDGVKNPTPGDPSFEEYMVLNVSVSAGDKLQLWDKDNHAGWAVTLDGASVAGISRDGDHYNCTVDGCYDFYIKIKYPNDQLYIGKGSDCGGGDAPAPATGWVLKGSFNGWGDTQFTAKSGGAANTIYAVATLKDAGREYEFKLYNNGTWYGNDGLMTQAHCTDWTVSSSAGNCKIMATIAGNYEFAYNTSTKKVTVTYPYNPKQATLYKSAVQDKNGDVMIQAFYWAHEGSTSTPYTQYGDVTWKSLLQEAETLGQYFDLVWLAPSQETADYTGYLPVNYSNQGTVSGNTEGHSPWGNAQELRELIDKLHANGAKVIADIVLNHSSASHADEYPGPNYNWCTWNTFDFGRYGKFNPDYLWVTADDEMYATDHVDGRIDKTVTGECGSHAGSKSLFGDERGYTYIDVDNGYKETTAYWDYGEYNCMYSRDWAHVKTEVQEMSRAYLTWMRDSMRYDGWRFDFMKGFEGRHLEDYLRASAPYFSVAEVFDGAMGKQLGFLKDANYSTYVFDFPGKFDHYNKAIGVYQLSNLKNKKYSLIFTDKKKYAVTFIDNHDSFREGSNFTGSVNQVSAERSPMALAYLLSMPGVPCVIYPYWNNYKEECLALIKARKAAGVHSESTVEKEWAGSGAMGDNYYMAMIKGEKGYLFLKLGYDCSPKVSPSVDGKILAIASPDGKEWKCAWANHDHAGVWYTGDDWTPIVPTENVENVVPAVKATKFIENGVLYIQRGNEIYNAQGQRIR